MFGKKTDSKQSKVAKVKSKVATTYTKLGILAAVPASNVVHAALAQPDVSEATTYIEGLTSGAGFNIAMAGLMMTIGIRGLKRIRGAF